jgi:hypothetical protein
MDMTKLEGQALCEIAGNESNFQELTMLELAIVGGGTGDITLGQASK